MYAIPQFQFLNSTSCYKNRIWWGIFLDIMLFVAWFAVSKNHKQSECPWVGNWINHGTCACMWACVSTHNHTGKYYLGIYCYFTIYSGLNKAKWIISAVKKKSNLKTGYVVLFFFFFFFSPARTRQGSEQKKMMVPAVPEILKKKLRNFAELKIRGLKKKFALKMFWKARKRLIY